eukprot:scaffold5182_cov376-Prasinococcus_capsulatus_cf.AAC.5
MSVSTGVAGRGAPAASGGGTTPRAAGPQQAAQRATLGGPASGPTCVRRRARPCSPVRWPPCRTLRRAAPSRPRCSGQDSARGAHLGLGAFRARPRLGGRYAGDGPSKHRRVHISRAGAGGARARKFSK